MGYTGLQPIKNTKKKMSSPKIQSAVSAIHDDIEDKELELFTTLPPSSNVRAVTYTQRVPTNDLESMQDTAASFGDNKYSLNNENVNQDIFDLVEEMKLEQALDEKMIKALDINSEKKQGWFSAQALK